MRGFMDTSEISNSQPNYQQEFKQGVDLFEKGFHQMQSSKFDRQRMEYQKSMNESLQVIKDAAAGLMNKELSNLKDELAKDYQNYLIDPTKENEKRVEKDISSLKKAAEE
jgi:succinate dehydrogenase/fumarate reductase flavoprotein subunit